MRPDGFWEGRLSASALSTATAISALCLGNAENDAARIGAGVAWLVQHQNADRGWGDTADSPSNLATTLLAVAALKLADSVGGHDPHAAGAIEGARGCLASCTAGTPREIVQAIRRQYGDDRTFAVPILMNLALAGLVSWTDVSDLPFELAVLPHRWYKVLRLHVVSYALPALIAIGLAIDHHHPRQRLLRQWIRRAITSPVLEKLEPHSTRPRRFSGGHPLNQFCSDGVDLPVRPRPARGREVSRISPPVATRRGELADRHESVGVADDGRGGGPRRGRRAAADRWPSNRPLDRRPTIQDAASLYAGGARRMGLDSSGRRRARRRRYRGGDHRPGGVGTCRGHQRRCRVAAGVAKPRRRMADVLSRLGKTPVRQERADLTAHALRALCCADPPDMLRPLPRAIRNGLNYLGTVQQADGSWIPLWFGNQGAPGHSNPVLGTSRVLRALEHLAPHGPLASRGVEYLLRSQNADGGWGGAAAVPSSQEETAMAVAALAPWGQVPNTSAALFHGVEYLVQGLDRSGDRPRPIGLYFSHLWYSETLYPLIWTIEALGRATKLGRPREIV